MKKWLYNLVAAIIVSICVVEAVPAYAGTFRRAHTNASWDIKERTVGGAVFRSGTYNNGTWTLYATYKGKTTLLSSTADGGTVISDGRIVYYAAKKNSKWYAYKWDLKTGKCKKLVKLASHPHLVDLEGYYNGFLYYILDNPVGTLKKVSLSTKKSKTVRKGATGTDWTGRYFVIYDGTGAGYSYIDALDCKKGKLRTIVKFPAIWVTTNKYVYYVEVIKGDQWELLAGKNVTANIKRYTLSSGKRKTILNNIRMKKIMEFDSKHIKYVNQKNAVKTKKW